MKKIHVPSLDLEISNEFDVKSYGSVQSYLAGMLDQSKINPDNYHKFSGAWRALFYRLKTCEENDATFTKNLKEYGDTPEQPYRYIQDRELFSFFVNCLSVFESFCFGLFAIASMIDPSNFQIQTDDDERKIKPTKTLGKFQKKFNNENITTELEKVLSSDEYERWNKTRNILVHRDTPGRIMSVWDIPAIWKRIDITIDEKTTNYNSLLIKINELLKHTDTFTKKHII